MCKKCVKEPHPDRGYTCLETGTYLFNFQHCHDCGKRDQLSIANKKETNEEFEDEISYDHVCRNCDHVIAQHNYSFRVEGDYQDYEMNCLLCGRGDDIVSILPNDPKHDRGLF